MDAGSGHRFQTSLGSQIDKAQQPTECRDQDSWGLARQTGLGLVLCNCLPKGGINRPRKLESPRWGVLPFSLKPWAGSNAVVTTMTPTAVNASTY